MRFRSRPTSHVRVGGLSDLRCEAIVLSRTALYCAGKRRLSRSPWRPWPCPYRPCRPSGRRGMLAPTPVPPCRHTKDRGARTPGCWASARLDPPFPASSSLAFSSLDAFVSTIGIDRQGKIPCIAVVQRRICHGASDSLHLRGARAFPSPRAVARRCRRSEQERLAVQIVIRDIIHQ